MVASCKVRHAERTPRSAVTRTVAEVARQAAAQAGVAPPGAAGTAGVGVAGQCLGATGLVLNAPNLGWRDVPFGALLARGAGPAGAHRQRPLGGRLGRAAPSGRPAAWTTRCWSSSARGWGPASSSAGGSTRAATAWPAELGHIKVTPRGAVPRRCGCGEWGCLEAYAGGMNLAARVREELADGRAAAVLAAAGDAASISASSVEAAYLAGDPYARELWAEVGELLGTAMRQPGARCSTRRASCSAAACCWAARTSSASSRAHLADRDASRSAPGARRGARRARRRRRRGGRGAARRGGAAGPARIVNRTARSDHRRVNSERRGGVVPVRIVRSGHGSARRFSCCASLTGSIPGLLTCAHIVHS